MCDLGLSLQNASEVPLYEMSRIDDITPINEELPTPDISEMSMHKEQNEPSAPVGEFLMKKFAVIK
jgi:hypothetical protein